LNLLSTLELARRQPILVVMTNLIYPPLMRQQQKQHPNISFSENPDET
jgi:hypothetical protein